ncbi:YceI family protein [Flavobacterium cellulosilyticum]|uniref:YceI family protein n=1 Tax=Flavobacterium cellulosilyticum TaxID=2541731 RepID=A0A4V2YZG3_9FLAO|nr:YceI family protein [Flavobacterium cellulosilyticum]TDD96977.1 YceI family protein [Flavobacterium cellulosilyticum]
MKTNKLIIATICLLAGNIIFSQKLMTRKGEVKFEASMAAFEEIAGTNNTASCILDESTADFAALVLIKAFKFKSPLMEEHFNENYMESSKFPKASFKGKIAGFDVKKLSVTKSTYDLEGDITIHGVTKKIKTKLNLSQNGDKIIATSVIFVKPQDYKIEIPNLVKDKIAENVKISMSFTLEAN